MSSGIPVVSVVGRSGSGKTTLLEKLIRELKRRGYRLAVVKHHYHAGLEFDVPGKDSYRFAQAGADHVVVAGPDRTVHVRRWEREPTLADVVAHIDDADLVLTEGYKQADAPKIEVYRSAQDVPAAGSGERGADAGLLSRPDELVAIVSDSRWSIQSPQFDLEDVSGLVDLIEARFLKPGPGG